MTNEEFGIIKGYKAGVVEGVKTGKKEAYKEVLKGIDRLIYEAMTSSDIYRYEEVRKIVVDLLETEQ